MTEEQWLRCTDPMAMLAFLVAKGKASERKVRLFACACRRRVGGLFADERSRVAMEASERYAEGLVSKEDLRASQEGAWAAFGAAWDAESPGQRHAAQAGLLRDIFGPLPFRRVAVPAAVLFWNSGCVVKLAAGIYGEAAFDRVPVLGDALEEAGMTDQDILGHCREQEAVHAKGCWVIDLLLDKE
jgi:hypothetical protein